MSWDEDIGAINSSIEAAHRWRAIVDNDAFGVEGVVDGKPVVSFASNDYLGLSTYPDVIAAAAQALTRWGAGSGSARLISGARPIHRQLEDELAAWKHSEAALLLPTGYMTNLAVLSALGTEHVTILSDELNHASIIDGCRLSRAAVIVYPHRDLAAVERELKAAGKAIVVTDAVFSMDGDAADVSALAELCARHDALLVVDEAHAVLEDEPDLGAATVLRVGTLSKTLGSAGGFVAGDRTLIEHLTNRARPFIFTTAGSPADAAAALAALHVLLSSEGAALVARLRHNVERVRPGHRSPIVPIHVGEEQRALELSQQLFERGAWVPAIRPPSVPDGTARLRIGLSAAHQDHHIDLLVGALAEVAGVGPNA